MRLNFGITFLSAWNFNKCGIKIGILNGRVLVLIVKRKILKITQRNPANRENYTLIGARNITR